MPKIDNIQVYGIEDSFRASKFPFAVDASTVDGSMTDRIKSLANCKMGTGHDNFLNGIIVQFDLTFSITAWVDLQRYHFIDFPSSQSTIHSISKMDIKPMCNEYVSDVVIAEKTVFDISTISRVVNSKYIETHFGIYSLNYLFSEGL